MTRSNPPETGKTEEFLRLPQVLKRLGVGKSSFYELAKTEPNLRPLKPFGGRISVWPSSKIDAFIADRIKAGGQ